MKTESTNNKLDAQVASASSAASDSAPVTTATDVADSEAVAKKLTVVGVAGNVALAAVKLAAGLISNSAAMISDAIHSISDIVATLIAYVGVRIGSREADEAHPYGHERFESLATLTLALILLFVGLGIGYSGATTIYAYIQAGGDAAAAGMVSDAPLAIALAAAVISIGVKEGMYWYTRHWALIINSPAFLADAKHHRSDSLSSVAALIGIGAAMLGFPLGDPIAGVIISFFIIYMSWEIVVDAVNRMIDSPCDPETEAAIRACIAEQPGVVRVDLLRTRMFGARIFVDAEIALDGNLLLVDAHDIAEATHDAVEERFRAVKHIMIHVNPS